MEKEKGGGREVDMIVCISYLRELKKILKLFWVMKVSFQSYLNYSVVL